MASHLITDSALLSQRPTAAEREVRIAELRRQMFLDLDMFGLVWSSHYYVAPTPDLTERIDRLSLEELEELTTVDATSAEYVHWDDIRFMEPRGGITAEEWWLRIRLARTAMRRELPLMGHSGGPLSYAEPDQVVLPLSAIDGREAGYCSGTFGDALLEEGICSSALAGAAVSPETAERLVGDRAAPEDDGEFFLMRNVDALEFVRRRANTALTPELVLELEQILTGEGPGRVRPGSDDVVERLQRMCEFANGGGADGDVEMHPVVRAILVHFWVLYDHLFPTANGRIGRALLYWAFRRAGYRMFDGLSISRELRMTPSQYCRSFVEADTDGGDVTYFLIDQLNIIQRAIARADGMPR
jgi:hypothetical protein